MDNHNPTVDVPVKTRNLYLLIVSSVLRSYPLELSY